MQLLKRTLSILTLGVLVFGYQNCAKLGGANVAGGLSFSSNSAGGCSGILSSTYQSTYYPTFQNLCAGCHSTGGTGQGAFADPNFTVAFKAFESLTRPTVETLFQSPTHQNGITGTPSDLALVANSAATWTEAETNYNSCIVATGGTTVTTLTANEGNAAILTAPQTLTWDLSQAANNSASYPITVTMKIQVATDPSGNKVYNFINPTAKLNAGASASYEIKGMAIYMNNNLLAQMTTFNQIDVTVSSTTAAPIMTVNALYAGSTPAASDVFALSFQSISAVSGSTTTTGGGGTTSSTLPSSVEYSDLMSSNATLGVFSANCIGCHNGANAQGGLDITNYAEARSAAQMIHVRMNNASNPMPPTGVLSTTQRAIVDIWINTGMNE